MKGPGFDRDGRSVEELERVEIQEWVPDPERPGYLKHVRTKTVNEVFHELREIVGDYPEGCDEGCPHPFPTIDGNEPWPDGRIAVYPVTGGSEGHYVHVTVEVGSVKREDGARDHQTRLVLLGKDLGSGWDAAWVFAKKVAELLEV